MPIVTLFKKTCLGKCHDESMPIVTVCSEDVPVFVPIVTVCLEAVPVLVPTGTVTIGIVCSYP